MFLWPQIVCKNSKAKDCFEKNVVEEAHFEGSDISSKLDSLVKKGKNPQKTNKNFIAFQQPVWLRIL